MPKNEIRYANDLYKAILCLETEEECRRFFVDICTIPEIEALAQRLEVAKKLFEGKRYAEVNQLTGASTATICRVSKSLNYGDGGYRTVLERCAKED